LASIPILQIDALFATACEKRASVTYVKKGQKIVKRHTEKPLAISQLHFLYRGEAQYGGKDNEDNKGGRLFQPRDAIVEMSTVRASEEIVATTDCVMLTLGKDDLAHLLKGKLKIETEFLLLRLAYQSETARVMCQMLRAGNEKELAHAATGTNAWNKLNAATHEIYTTLKQHALDYIQAPPVAPREPDKKSGKGLFSPFFKK
jgi:hypothetical protein